MTRILHVYRCYYPDLPGGLLEAIRQISQTTQPFGVESRIFALSKNPHPVILERPEGNVYRAKSYLAPASCDIGGLGCLLEFRRQVQWADIVHYHFPWPFADMLHFLARVKKPCVMTYHSDVVRQKYLDKLYFPLMRTMLKSMDAVVATSPAYAKTSPILTQYVHPDHLWTIPLGIEDETHQPVNDSLIESKFGLKKNSYFLSLSVLRYYKGLHTLVEAAPLVDAPIVIAGSGPEGDNLKILSARKHAHNVLFTGQVSDEEKLALIKHCRALVMPSHLRSEAFGMSLIEAAMFGKPMICCEIGTGTSYVNLDGVTGYVVAPEQREELAHAMNTLNENAEYAAAMGKAARIRYIQLFSGQSLGNAYSQLYNEVIDTKKAA